MADNNDSGTQWHAPFSVPKMGSFSQADPTSGVGSIIDTIVNALKSGVDPQQILNGGAPQGQAQADTSMLSPQPVSGGAAASMQPTGGQGSAPPSGPSGQVMGAPQPPQQPQQGYGGWGQAAAPPMQGPGPGGAPDRQSFSQAPWMASPQNDYALFSKANPAPKPPTAEDAIDYVSKMDKAGMLGFGFGSGNNSKTNLVAGAMDALNAQYAKQMELHQGAWTGQVGAAHNHNSDMAQQERMAHDRAQEAAANRRQTEVEKKDTQIQGNKDRAFNGMSAAQQARHDESKRREDDLVERVTSARTAKEKGEAAKALAEHYKQQMQWVTTLGVTGQMAGDQAAEQKASDAAQALGPPPGAAPDTAQKPQAPPEAVAYLKAHPEMKKAFEEKYAPVQ